MTTIMTNVKKIKTISQIIIKHLNNKVIKQSHYIDYVLYNTTSKKLITYYAARLTKKLDL